MARQGSMAEAGNVRAVRATGGGTLRRSAVEDVRAQIVAIIRSGEVKVDDRLPPEMELARHFGVSRPVVREAIVGLNALGLIQSRNGRGTFVTSTSVNVELMLGGHAAADLNEVRRCLELPAARLAAVRRTARDIREMERILAALDAEDAADRRNRIDAAFHIAIAAASRNTLLTKLIADLRCGLEDESLTVSVVQNRRAGARAEHRAILSAITTKDADAASQAMQAHLDAIDASIAVLRQAPVE